MPVFLYWGIRYVNGDISFLVKRIEATNLKQNRSKDSSLVVDELIKWNDLKDKGVITEAELQDIKDDLLK